MSNYRLINHKKYSWYHYNQGLTSKDHQFLIKTFKLNQEHLKECNSHRNHRSKVHVSKSGIYLVFHLPYKPKNSHTFSTSELNVFITKSTLVTVESAGNLSALDNYLIQTQKSKATRERRFKQGPANLFGKLMLFILTDLYNLVDKQGLEIDQLQQQIFQSSPSKKFIQTISLIRYNQIVTNSILERQLRTFEPYKNTNNPFVYFDSQSRAAWNNIIDMLITQYYETQSDKHHLESLVNTFESIVSHQTNEVIKTLTIFSVLLMPLTLITGIYGMNFASMPLLHEPLGFIVISAFMAIIASIMALVFKLKRWV